MIYQIIYSFGKYNTPSIHDRRRLHVNKLAMTITIKTRSSNATCQQTINDYHPKCQQDTSPAKIQHSPKRDIYLKIT